MRQMLGCGTCSSANIVDSLASGKPINSANLVGFTTKYSHCQ